jgi:hypothetical protein
MFTREFVCSLATSPTDNEELVDKSGDERLPQQFAINAMIPIAEKERSLRTSVLGRFRFMSENPVLVKSLSARRQSVHSAGKPHLSET